MKYEEIDGDLFEVPHVSEYADGYYYAHCIASDLGMGAGIAVPMAKKFDLRNRLKTAPRFVREYPTVLLSNGIFNMITKQHSSGKPKYEDLIISLKMVRSLCFEEDIKKLAMPLIGCGLDGLSWDVVSALIQDLFKDLDIEIKVVKYVPAGS